MTRAQRWLGGLLAGSLLALAGLAAATWQARLPLPATLGPDPRTPPELAAIVAADGTPLTRSFRGRFNHNTGLPLSHIPILIRHAFISAEDQRFWQHGGIDWRARFAALWTNLRAGHVVRGASTIAEQSVRLLQPRPRTYWSRWMEGMDAGRLLQRFGHAGILTFYLNQVPYGAQRRGVVQGADYYFGRDPGALNAAQQLALAVLIRSPRRYDPRRHPTRLRTAVDALSDRMRASGLISADRHEAILRSPLTPGHRGLELNAGPFVTHARQQAHRLGTGENPLRTTLDSALQGHAQRVLERQQQTLATRQVRQAAALVVDNRTGHILAWAVAPPGGAHAIDPVVTPRQPGSTLKPFVYGLAMARLGWQADHLLMDAPLAESIAGGTHHYRNYSGKHYGKVSLRYALGNSLNLPVVRAAQAVGVQPLLNLFRDLGIRSLRHSAAHYGAAIALGDGEVSLLELVQAYATLARHGQYLPLTALISAPRPDPQPVLPAAISSLLAHILADDEARAAEFGADSLLNLSPPTAMKTGTSSDYRDSWTVGFDDRYTVGVWMGRLDGGYMNHVTGSEGAAPVVRQLFAHLRQQAPPAGLWRSPELQPVTVCEWLGELCTRRREWYLPDSPSHPDPSAAPVVRPSIGQPLPGEQLAIDPRLPRAAQRYRFVLTPGSQAIERIEWRIDGEPVPGNADADHSQSWALRSGQHALTARVWFENQTTPEQLGPVRFHVAGNAPE